MPTRDATPLGAPAWVDLMTSDPERSYAFYGELLGWTVVDPGPEFGGYVNFAKDDVLVAGCMRNTPEMQTPDVWSVYLAVADAQKTIDTAVASGAQVIVAPMPIADLGTMAVVLDPGAAAVGMWEPGTHKGIGILAEPGAPAWFELNTRDFDRSVEFYRKVFGWDTHVESDAPDMRYTTLGRGEDAQAGIMDASAFLPEGVPAHWGVYFQVENADAAEKRVADLGGAVVVPAIDTPYGRLSTLTDATGAMFKLVQDLG
jgi:predicted enzyme related to lactoylglutathione lyase